MLAANTGTRALRNEFGGIAMLLTMVAALNNSGHSTLMPVHGHGPYSLHSMLDINSQNSADMIASLVVRDEEEVVVTSVLPPAGQSPDKKNLVLIVQNEQDGEWNREEGTNGHDSWSIDSVGERDNDNGAKSNEEGDMANAATASFMTLAKSRQNGSQNTDYQITIVKNSQSHWPSISPLQHLDVLDPNKLIIPKNDPFENHLATMTDFINEYREEKDTKKRIRLFWKFSAYISLVSWPKTYQRLMNWTSKGFVHTLTRVPLNELRSRAKNLRDTNPMRKRSNNSLLSDVSSLCKQDGAVKDLMDRLSSIEFEGSHYKPDNLNDLLHGLEAEKDDPACSAYNEVTAIQFHFLLLAILVGYITVLKERDYIRAEEGKATESEAKMRAEQKKEAARKRAVRNELRKQEAKQCAMKNSERAAITRIEGEGGTVRRIEEDEGRMAKKNETNEGRTSESKEDKKTTPNLTECQRRVWQYGRILWTVTSSRMFDDYLQSLQGLLGVVNPNQMSLYTSLFKDLGLEGDVRNGHIEDVEEEQRWRMNLRLTTSDAEPIIWFKYWTRLITRYARCLHRVTTDSKARSHGIGAKVVIVKHFSSSSSPVTLNWLDIIHNLCGQDGEGQPLATASLDSSSQSTSHESLTATTRFTKEHADEAIKKIQQCIDQNRYGLDIISAFGRNKPSGKLSAQTDNKSKAVIEVGQVVLKGNTHCEAMSAALLMFFNGQENIRKLFLSCNLREISSSKLCCPICWELLQVLRRNKQEICMRGYHTSLYPVALPSLLPEDVLKEMVTRFRIHLRRELFALLKSP